LCTRFKASSWSRSCLRSCSSSGVPFGDQAALRQ
jgi:hypothetical protein